MFSCSNTFVERKKKSDFFFLLLYLQLTGEDKLKPQGSSPERSQTFLHGADISAAADLGFVSAPMSWRISQCAPALPEHISIPSLPGSFPSAVFSLMSRRSSDMLTRNFMLTQFSLSLENILLPAAGAKQNFFIFFPSPFAADQRPLLHC